MKTIELLRRARSKPPSYLARRAMREAERLARAGWLRRKLRDLSAAKLARELGHPSLVSFRRDLTRSGFIYSAPDREQLRHLYQTSYGAECKVLREEVVRRILAHEFDILGSGPTRLGAELDWHLDFKSGRRWDLSPCRKIDYAELDRPTDVKVPWELSRGHHLVALGQAWLVCQDDRAAREFESQIRSWIRSNPAGFGVNWACTMEVALRAVNWIWCLGLFSDAPLSDAFWDETLPALYRHGLWIPENLEVSQVNGNHYIADALGLVACGLLFRPSLRGRSWLELGSRILEEEIRVQVGEDGADIEASIPYHRLVLEIFLVGARLLELAGLPPSREYRKRLESMVGFVHAYTLPDGLSPVVGDNDDGRVLVFGKIPKRDHRYLISSGCALFGRSEWKQRAGRFWEDSLWLLGPSFLDKYEQLQEEPSADGSRAFPASGFYILRSAQQYVLVDAGPVGFRGLGGHGHNDCLSFEWHLGNLALLVDSGLFVYTASPELRDLFRSTEFHNTIRVDYQEINRFLSPPTLWFLGNDAQPLEVSFRQENGKDYLHAGHTGYQRLSDPVTVFRSFEVDHCRPRIRMIDRLEGKMSHVVEFFFHAAPGAEAYITGEHSIEFRWPRKASLRIEREAGPALRWEVKQGWFAPAYGVRVPRPVCVAAVQTRLPFEMKWKLAVCDPPESSGSSPGEAL